MCRANRPPGVTGRADKYLADLAQDLRRLLLKTQQGFADPRVCLPEPTLNALAVVLVESGEDLHADIGLWRSLETYNREFFSMPLPLATQADKAREFTRDLHAEFVTERGSDLVVYPDGLTLAAAEQKRLAALWQAADPAQVSRAMNERGLKPPRPPMHFPRKFLDHDQGIGAFFNPDEGEEFMLGFDHILSGLGKKGDGLSVDERDALRHFVTHNTVSPAFVHRVVREHGAESLVAAFHLSHLPPERALAFLLRCHKGRFYRNRYPTLSLGQSDAT